MTKNSQQAYRNGYVNGLRRSKKMRCHGTFLGNLLKGSSYRPDREYCQAMEDASAVEWTPPE